MSFYYEAGNVTVSWYGVDLSKGWAEDTFLTITPNSPRVEHKVGADGKYTFSKIADKGCTITMTFQDVADANVDIAAVLATQDMIGNAIPFGPFTVTDTTGGGDSFITENAVLTEAPEISYQKASGERTWTWVCETFLLTDNVSTLTASLASYMK